MPDIFDQLPGTDKGKGDIFDAFNQSQEGFWKSAARTALQIPQGIAEATPPAIAAGLWHLLGQGEVFDPAEIEQIKNISEREGIPFDEEKYIQAAQQAGAYIPTVSNIGREVEERTGLPLEPKTGLQKGIRLGSTAAKFQPGTTSQKAVAGVTAPAVSTGLQQLGIPEQVAELAGLATGAGAGALTPEIALGKAKPSGMMQRGFETLQKPREVSENKMLQINTKLKEDFKGIANKIIKESPVGETFEQLRADPAFKQESRELLKQAQVIADEIPGTIETAGLKKAIAKQAEKSFEGYVANEYDKAYAKNMAALLDEIKITETTPGKLVKQYRKNNNDLFEYYEPGASKAHNRAKFDAILDHNRAIATFMEESFPTSELSPVFKEGNARWTRIKDAETIDTFINDFFKGKVNYKKGHTFFDDRNTERIFKRALGDNYKQFEQLMGDVLGSETGYKMLQVAKKKGFNDLFHSAKYFLIHPKVGALKASADLAKTSWKFLLNTMLDKPKIAISLKKAIDSLKRGNFVAAEKDFKTIQGEILPSEAKPPAKTGETIEVTPERVQPKAAETKLLEGPKEKTIKRPEQVTEAPKAKETAPVSDESEKNAILRGFMQPAQLKEKIKRLEARLKEEKKHSGPLSIKWTEEELAEANADLSAKETEIKQKKAKEEPKPKAPKKTKLEALQEAESSLTKERDALTRQIDNESKRHAQLGERGQKEYVESLEKKHDALTDKINKVREKVSHEKEPSLKPKKKTKLEALDEALQVAIKKNERRQLEAIKAAHAHPQTRRLREEQAKASYQRVKDIEEAIAELKEQKQSKKAETKPKIEEKLKKVERQDISKKGLKEQKQHLLNELDKAIKNAPEFNTKPQKLQTESGDAFKDRLEKWQGKNEELLTFKVPGDGTFKIKNHKKALEAFRDSVDKRWPDKPLKISKKELRRPGPTQKEFEAYVKQHGTR